MRKYSPEQEIAKSRTLVTGASGQIGGAICKKLAEQRHDLFITGRNKERLQILLAELNKINPQNRYFAKQCDFNLENSPRELFFDAQEKLLGLTSMICSAGLYLWSPIERELEPQKAEKELLRVNLEVPYFLCKLFAQASLINKIDKTDKIQEREVYKKIVLIGSISGLVGEANASLYSSTKAGLLGLVKALALELAEKKININLINPGWVKTSLLEKDLSLKNISEQEILECTPQRRWVEPLEIAELASFLLSDRVDSLTGQSINLCAGLSLG